MTSPGDDSRKRHLQSESYVATVSSPLLQVSTRRDVACQSGITGSSVSHSSELGRSDRDLSLNSTSSGADFEGQPLVGERRSDMHEILAMTQNPKLSIYDARREDAELNYNAFLSLRESLIGNRSLKGKYVAVVDGRVVDSDLDDEVLVIRVRKQHPGRTTYIGLVSESEV